MYEIKKGVIIVVVQRIILMNDSSAQLPSLKILRSQKFHSTILNTVQTLLLPSYRHE